MKILFLQDDFPPQSFGGAGITAFNFAKALKEKGHEIYIITTVRSRGEEEQIEYYGLKVFKIYANYHQRLRAYLSLYNPQTVKKVRDIINSVKPDVVHARNIHYYLSYHCLRLAKQSGAKVFLSAHDVMLFNYGKLIDFVDSNDLSCPASFNYNISSLQQFKNFKKRYNPFRNIIIRWYLKYTDKISAVSYALKEALRQNGIKNVEVIHTGIDVGDWQVNESKIHKFKQKHNLMGKRVVLLGGRLSEAKGGRQAILSMKEVISKIPDTLLMVVGNKNEYAQELMEIAEENGIAKNLIFTGWIFGDDLIAAYHTCDVVIVPSVCFDSFPRANLEAMACKRPVVTTCFGGSGELVRDGFSGYVINPYDIRLFSKKVLYLLNNPNEARELTENGYKLIQEKFNLGLQAKKLLNWYQS